MHLHGFFYTFYIYLPAKCLFYTYSVSRKIPLRRLWRSAQGEILIKLCIIKFSDMLSSYKYCQLRTTSGVPEVNANCVILNGIHIYYYIFIYFIEFESAFNNLNCALKWPFLA